MDTNDDINEGLEPHEHEGVEPFEHVYETPAPAGPVTTKTPSTAWTHGVLVVALVISVGALGFITGHWVDRPKASTTTNAGVTYPNYGYGNGGTGFNLPTFPGYSNGSSATSSADAQAAKIAKTVDDGLVDVTSTYSDTNDTAEGTGMVLTSDGLVLTNNHVIEGASTITARDVATGTTYSATVVGYDVKDDVALLQLANASGLSTVTTGDSSTVAAGDVIVGIGNAEGVGGTPSYAAGTVVALDKSITASDETNPAGAEKLYNLIEINAAIEPGDSGGPLVNAKGEVVGMDTAGSQSGGGFGYQQSGPASSTEGYAIPINAALKIAKAIENNEASADVHVGATAFLGVEIKSAAAAGATTTNGVRIAEVIARQPAANAGLVAGDVITAVDGQNVSSGTTLQSELLTLSAGETVTVDYDTAAGVAKSVSLTLTSGPAQ